MGRAKWWMTLVGAAFACVLVTSRATAQDARALFQQGQAAYQAGEYESAIEAWERAYAMDPRPALQYNLAQAYGRLARVEEEAAALRLYIAGALAAGTASDDSQIVSARARLSAIADRIRRTGIQLTGVPAGAHVLVDGTPNMAGNGEAIRLDGLGFAGQAGSLVNNSGDNLIAATSSIIARPVSLGEIRLASLAGTLTIDGAVNLNSSKLSVDGVANTVINGNISGAGATFPYPIYAKWADAYKKETGIGLNYQSIGSGGGIKQITAKTVDFGASDMPLKTEDLEKAGLVQFPAVMGGVVMIVNLEGIAPGQLKLTGALISDIYLGRVATWNDPAIAKLNPDVKLAGDKITVVHRADGSGTSFLFTDYLSKASPQWKEKVGANTAVAWPAGVGGKGNEGVASYVQRIKGAIGYVEYAYAKKNKMAHTQLQNRDGNWVQPDDPTFQAAAAGADWKSTPNFYQVLTDQPGKESWPITGASFILMHKSQANGEKGREVLKFFEWALKNGGQMATDLDYVPLPGVLVKLVEDSWRANIKDTGGKAVWQ